MKEIILDEGYMFGIGVFETIAVEEERPILLELHIERLKRGLKQLGIEGKFIGSCTIEEYIKENQIKTGVVKVMVSKENIVFSHRDNVYTEKDYDHGFSATISNIIRNETSRLTYIKSFHYGDNLLEKRRAKERGYDEPIFLNTKGQICEGSCTNLFFVKEGRIYTPKIECGLLEGTMRKYLCNKFPIIETTILPQQIGEFEEAFFTNALIGVMPICNIDDIYFKKRKKTLQLQKEYQEEFRIKREKKKN